MDMIPVITKEQAIEIFGSPSKLAEALGIFPAAVSQWKPGEPIPHKRSQQILELKPDLFV